MQSKKMLRPSSCVFSYRGRFEGSGRSTGRRGVRTAVVAADVIVG